MTHETISIKSLLPYQVLQFIVIFVMALVGYTIAEIALVYLSDITIWITAVTLVLLIETCIIIPLSAWMKLQVSMSKPEWDIREKDILLSEYRSMYKEYTREYSYFLTLFDFTRFILLLVTVLGAYLLPYLLLMNIVTLIASPFSFGAITILYGLVLSSFIFKLIPNECSEEFHIVPPRQVQKYIDLLASTAGIAWAGVSVHIGESSGYYIVRNTKPAARIDGIEGVGKILISLHDGDSHLEISYHSNQSDSIPEEKIPLIASDKEVVDAIDKTLRMVLLEYVSIHGHDEIIDEILTDVGLELKDDKSDELISTDE